VLRTIDFVRLTRIDKVVQESSNIRSFIFEDEACLSAIPGQFVMVWLPGIGEFPMSVSLNYERKSSIVIKPMGEGSRSLYNSSKGDFLGIRGPYGRGFTIPRTNSMFLLVGGGTGIAPIMRLTEEISKIRVRRPEVRLVIGARTKSELPFLPTMKKRLGSGKVYPATDDGTLGFKGFAHEQVEALCEEFDIDKIFCCGPEPMMLKIFNIARKNRIRAEFSLERIMKCGIAICGSCCIEDLVLCRDGPVLNDEVLRGISKEFGRLQRDKTGALVKKS
jgi:dihydroorotate dehydrogenase electron transfer subunit